jgi:hypothetical protein
MMVSEAVEWANWVLTGDKQVTPPTIPLQGIRDRIVLAIKEYHKEYLPKSLEEALEVCEGRKLSEEELKKLTE